MEAEPEIALIKPGIYAVNEEGDKPEKGALCEKLECGPKPGLTLRSSTDLRRF